MVLSAGLSRNALELRPWKCYFHTLVPEVFREAAKKTSDNGGTESHFHAVDSCQICRGSNDTINQSLGCSHK